MKHINITGESNTIAILLLQGNITKPHQIILGFHRLHEIQHILTLTGTGQLNLLRFDFAINMLHSA